MYIMKIRGVNNMPDFVQVRDNDFTLIAYFRADKPEKANISFDDNLTGEKIIELLLDVPYGRMHKV